MSQHDISIQRISELAKIELTDSECEQLQTEIEAILKMADSINARDLSAVQPFFGQVADDSDSLETLRTDRSAGGLNREQVLDNAPKTDGEHYLVPPVFG